MASLRDDVRNELNDYRTGARSYISNYHPGSHYYPYGKYGSYGYPHTKQSVSPVRRAKINGVSPTKRVEVKVNSIIDGN
jgi:hypothetical protein